MPFQTKEIIEYFVLGASFITCIYHCILFFQQRDIFLGLYANYLLSLTIYLVFRRVSHYDSFEVSFNRVGFALDYPIILYMLVSYVLFISKVLQIHEDGKIIKLAVYLFYMLASILLCIHVYKLLFTNETYLTRTFFAVSKLGLSACAFLGLFGAWYVRKTIFVRTIILGGFTYATFSLLTIISIYYKIKILGLYQYELYFVGCLFDILLFSSALGFRNHINTKEKLDAQKLLISEVEKNQLLLNQQHEIMLEINQKQQRQLAMHKTLQDEVGASLSSIHVFADLALNKKSKSEDATQLIQKISIQTQQLMDDIGDIIWLGNLNLEKPHDEFIQRVKNYGHEIVQVHDKICEYKINEYFHESNLSKEFIKEQLIRIKMKMKECVNDNSIQSMTIIFNCDKRKAFINIISA